MKRSVLAVLACAGAACAPVQLALAAPLRDDVAVERRAALEQLRRQDLRVATVAHRIVTASAGLCQDTGPVAGWVLHDLRQYGPNLRDEARAHFGLDEAAPSLLGVVQDGPAARAGLQADDVLLAVNGQTLASPAGKPKVQGDYAPMEAALARLDAAMRAGPVELTVRRSGVELTVVLAPVTACAYDAQLIPSEQLNASADGRHVFVTTAMADYAKTDDELAIVLGHEFAHDVLRHRTRLDQGGFARKLLGNLGTNPADLRRAEREADHAGLYLAARAGYDVSGARDFWRRFAADYGSGAYFSLSHPGARERAENIEATWREIEAKRAAGQPLVPVVGP
ncbi:M48 family metallopeptidase [Caulobacter sp. 17J65-9]|uniref:M48 family metallopeptidase n=1 Tax=Caulobacter sp. 17J65-9 TaxID=2709382 RepID=UPI0013C600A9|nr:M48 family metallopeptidase [Caulobacter sp. 17J65-9]NEX92344.1 M48 family metalloprotease [Caulobacter sp. 17J65-9]